jgi:hypothetical protein
VHEERREEDRSPLVFGPAFSQGCSESSEAIHWRLLFPAAHSERVGLLCCLMALGVTWVNVHLVKHQGKEGGLFVLGWPGTRASPVAWTRLSQCCLCTGRYPAEDGEVKYLPYTWYPGLNKSSSFCGRSRR